MGADSAISEHRPGERGEIHGRGSHELSEGTFFLGAVFMHDGGGIGGSVFFTYLGDAVRGWISKLRGRPPKPLSPRWVRFWERYGLWGVALLTPPILSPPIGTAIALAFRTPRGVLAWRLTIAMVLWGIVFAAFGEGLRSLIQILGG
jgi:hypothetical protein